ncbi:MAG: outer membrane beta-barrel protein [Oligoflexia bacterium]|nr:outer membrane beta-barrel protein [Oligoflexia bacterium]
MKQLGLCLFIALFIIDVANAQATAPKSKSYPTAESAALTDADTKWADEYGPWDFSGLVGWYSPALGIQALAAYRVMDNLIPDLDESLSLESGITLVTSNENVSGMGVTRSSFEIPIAARWDFRIPNTPIMAGPAAGFSYLNNSAVVNVNGQNDTNRGSGMFFRAGIFGMYRLQEQMWLRTDLTTGSFTTFKLGMTYAL